MKRTTYSLALYLISLFVLLETTPSVAQCAEYPRLIQEAKNYWKRDSFEKTFAKLNSAREVCPAKGKEVDSLNSAFNRDLVDRNNRFKRQTDELKRKTKEIQREKDNADNEKRNAILSKEQLARTLDTANAIKEVNRLNAEDGYKDFLQSIKEGRKLDLHLLTIGIDSYPNIPFFLNGCANDVRTVNKIFKTQQGKFFENIYEYPLLNANATTHNILTRMDSIARKAKRNDLVIIFFSGASSPNYVIAAEVKKRDTSEYIRGDIFCAPLLKCSANVVFIFDAQGGEQTFRTLANTNQSLDLQFLRSKIMVIGAASGNESAAEKHIAGEEGTHGILTHALIQGIQKGKADKDNNGTIYLDEFFLFAKLFVSEQTSDQTPFVIMPSTIRNMPLFQINNAFELPTFEFELAKKVQIDAAIAFKIKQKEIINIENYSKEYIFFKDSIEILKHNADLSAFSIKTIRDYENIFDIIQPYRYEKYKVIIAQLSDSLARRCIILKDYPKSEKYCRLYNKYRTHRAISSNTYIQKNLTHAILLQNRFEEAKIKYSNVSLYDALNDFEDFKKAGINSPYFEVLKKEWEEKYWQQLIQEQIASIEDTVKKYALYLSIDNKLSSLYAKQLTDTILRDKYIANLNNCGEFALYTKHYATSEQYYRQSLALDGQQPFVNSQLATALLCQNRYEEAKKFFAKSQITEGELSPFDTWRSKGVNSPYFALIEKEFKLEGKETSENSADEVSENEKSENEEGDTPPIQSINKWQSTKDSIAALSDTSEIYRYWSLRADSLEKMYLKDTTKNSKKEALIEAIRYKTAYAFWRGNYDEVLNLSQKGIKLTNGETYEDFNFWLKAYRSHALLFSDNYPIAKKSYIETINENIHDDELLDSLFAGLDKLASHQYEIKQIQEESYWNLRNEKEKLGELDFESLSDFEKIDSFVKVIAQKYYQDSTNQLIQRLFIGCLGKYEAAALALKQYPQLEWSLKQQLKYFKSQFKNAPFELIENLIQQHKYDELVQLSSSFMGNPEELDRAIDTIRYAQLISSEPDNLETVIKKIIQSYINRQ